MPLRTKKIVTVSEKTEESNNNEIMEENQDEDDNEDFQYEKDYEDFKAAITRPKKKDVTVTVELDVLKSALCYYNSNNKQSKRVNNRRVLMEQSRQEFQGNKPRQSALHWDGALVKDVTG